MFRADLAGQQMTANDAEFTADFDGEQMADGKGYYLTQTLMGNR